MSHVAFNDFSNSEILEYNDGEFDFLDHNLYELFLFDNQRFQLHFEYQLLQGFSYYILHMLLKYHQMELKEILFSITKLLIFYLQNNQTF